MDQSPDSDSYIRLRPLLLAMLACFRARGQGMADLAAFATARLGTSIGPYLLRFVRESMTEQKEPATEPRFEQAAPRVDQLAFLLAEQAGFSAAPACYWAQAEQQMAVGRGGRDREKA